MYGVFLLSEPRQWVCPLLRPGHNPECTLDNLHCASGVPGVMVTLSRHTFLQRCPCEKRRANPVPSWLCVQPVDLVATVAAKLPRHVPESEPCRTRRARARSLVNRKPTAVQRGDVHACIPRALVSPPRVLQLAQRYPIMASLSPAFVRARSRSRWPLGPAGMLRLHACPGH
jgi:hypothetical protein